MSTNTNPFFADQMPYTNPFIVNPVKSNAEVGPCVPKVPVEEFHVENSLVYANAQNLPYTNVSHSMKKPIYTQTNSRGHNHSRSI